MQDDINIKALAYAQKHEGRCLAKVSPNTYLWAYGAIFVLMYWKEHADGYNEELGLAFEYSGNQHYQIVPFFHLQGQMNLNAQIWRDWKKRALCHREGVILITIPYCVVDLETFIRSALYAFGIGGFFPTTILQILCRLGDHVGSVILRHSKGSFSHSPGASKNWIVVPFGNCGSLIPIGRLYFTDGLEYICSSFVASLGLIPINRVRLSFILSTILLANRSHSLQHLPVGKETLPNTDF
ncbi:P8.141C-like protein [Rhizophagus clarus]|uniref:P8.141C-like protein n=1 Tax=Rhizophagus clarus TaxID=94130 RepID=A0A8H3L9X1_9GLOM|nr:P8.141C-like protein [Rhizophagus clarus]